MGIAESANCGTVAIGLYYRQDAVITLTLLTVSSRDSRGTVLYAVNAQTRTWNSDTVVCIQPEILIPSHE